MISKKAQIEFPVITFIIVIVALFIISPFILKIFNSVVTPFGSAVGNVSADAGSSVEFIKDTAVSFWDYVVLMLYLLNVILLFITAFLVDTHPVFLVLFILFGLFTFMFAPGILDVVDKIYDQPSLALEVSQIPITDFLREHFGVILLGIFIVCGIIIYSKFKWGSQ